MPILPILPKKRERPFLFEIVFWILVGYIGLTRSRLLGVALGMLGWVVL